MFKALATRLQANYLIWHRHKSNHSKTTKCKA